MFFKNGKISSLKNAVGKTDQLFAIKKVWFEEEEIYISGIAKNLIYKSD